MAWVWLILGMAAMFFGAEYLVRGTCRLSARLGWPEFCVAVLVIGLGGCLPELVVTIGAAARGLGDVAVGGVIGANLIAILLLLGLAGLIRTLDIPIGRYKSYMIFLGLAAALLTLMVIDGEVSRIGAFALLLLFGGFLLREYLSSRKQVVICLSCDLVPTIFMTWKMIWLYIGMGGLVLIVGGHVFFDALMEILSQYNLSQAFVGTFVVAMATSMPEFIITLMAVKNNKTNIAFGNILGSSFIRIVLLLGLAGIISPLKISGSIQTFDIWVLLMAVGLLAWSMIVRKKITKQDAFLYLGAYGVYFAFLLTRM